MKSNVHLDMKRCQEAGVEHVVQVAIRCSGKTWVLNWPCRHGHIIQMLSQMSECDKLGPNTQGFVTNTGRFVDRKEAMLIARSAGQTTSDDEFLYSEDVW